jgi:hypothetical protein
MEENRRISAAKHATTCNHLWGICTCVARETKKKQAQSSGNAMLSYVKSSMGVQYW